MHGPLNVKFFAFVRRHNFSPEILPLDVEVKQFELAVCYNKIHFWGLFRFMHVHSWQSRVATGVKHW